MRELTPSLEHTCTKCDLTVASLMWSCAATSMFDAPSATSRRTSISRADTLTCGARMRAMRWPATAGARALSPAAPRTAVRSSSGGASLRRYPLAPASTELIDVTAAFVVGEGEDVGFGALCSDLPGGVRACLPLAELQVHKDEVGVQGLRRG